MIGLLIDLCRFEETTYCIPVIFQRGLNFTNEEKKNSKLNTTQNLSFTCTRFFPRYSELFYSLSNSTREVVDDLVSVIKTGMYRYYYF